MVLDEIVLSVGTPERRINVPIIDAVGMATWQAVLSIALRTHGLFSAQVRWQIVTRSMADWRTQPRPFRMLSAMSDANEHK